MYYRFHFNDVKVDMPYKEFQALLPLGKMELIPHLQAHFKDDPVLPFITLEDLSYVEYIDF